MTYFWSFVAVQLGPGLAYELTLLVAFLLVLSLRRHALYKTIRRSLKRRGSASV